MTQKIIRAGNLVAPIGRNEEYPTIIDGYEFVMLGSDIYRGTRIVGESDDPQPRLTLEELDNLLYRNSLKYRSGKDAIHEYNLNDRKKQGTPIPRLRTVLIRGLTRSDGSDSQLEKKILKKGDDFSSEEIKKFSRQIYQFMFKMGSGVTIDTIQGWIKGEIKSPQNWDDYRVLAIFNPEFQQLAQKKENESGYYQSYRDYVDMRRFFRGWKGRSLSEIINSADEIPDINFSGRFEDEKKIILDHCIIDTQRLVLGVDEVKDVNNNCLKDHGTVNHNGKSKYTIGRRVSKKPTNKNNISLSEIIHRHHILENIVTDSINNYLLHKYKGDLQSRFMAQPYIFSKIITRSVFESKIGLDTISSLSKVASIFGEKKSILKVENIFQEAYFDFLKDLNEGKIDHYFGLEDGTLSKAYNMMEQYRNALPNTFFKMRGILNEYVLLYAKLAGSNIKRKRLEKVKRVYYDMLRWTTIDLSLIISHHPKLDNEKKVFTEAEKLKKNYFSLRQRLSQHPYDYKQPDKSFLSGLISSYDLDVDELRTQKNLNLINTYKTQFEGMGYSLISKQDAIKKIVELGLPEKTVNALAWMNFP